MDIYLFQRSSDERSHCLQAESRITGNPCVCDNRDLFSISSQSVTFSIGHVLLLPLNPV